MYKKDFEKEIVAKYRADDLVYKNWDHFTKAMINILEKNKKTTGSNLIWERKGFIKPDEVLLIGASYDTIVIDKKTFVINEKATMPGADNNASGVACALGLIGILSEMEIPKTVRIVFFDFGELGFLGSKAYLTKLKSGQDLKKISGYVDFLMLGHDTKKTDKTGKLGNMKAYIRKPDEDGSVKDRKLAASLLRKEKYSGIDFALEENSFNSSNQIHFWEAGIPAIVFTQNWEDDYNADRHHTSNDFPETLNMKTLYNAFKYLSGSVIAWSFDIK
jgi:Zn-dependent M28 family amino/carboxypeptidase